MIYSIINRCANVDFFFSRACIGQRNSNIGTSKGIRWQKVAEEVCYEVILYSYVGVTRKRLNHVSGDEMRPEKRNKNDTHEWINGWINIIFLEKGCLFLCDWLCQKGSHYELGDVHITSCCFAAEDDLLCQEKRKSLMLFIVQENGNKLCNNKSISRKEANRML